MADDTHDIAADDAPGASDEAPPKELSGSELRRQAAVEWLEEHWKSPKKECPICLSKRWTVTDIQELRAFSGSKVQLGGALVPVFLVVCAVCGYIHFFSALKAGLVHPEPGGEATDRP